MAIKYEQRVGSLGTFITRVPYIIFINGQLAERYYYSPPSIDYIQNEILKLKSDMPIYPLDDTISKRLLSSLYVSLYPLNPPIRPQLEDKIKTGLNLLNLTESYANKIVKVLNYELCNGLISNQNISRVYYAVRIYNTSIFIIVKVF